MAEFKIGQRVKFMNDVGGGVVVAVEGDLVTIEDADGFEEVVPARELILDQSLEMDDAFIPKEEETSFSRQAKKANPKRRSEKLVDLHIEELTDQSTRHWPNFKIVTTQMQAAQKALHKARKGGTKYLILIHGVGDGVLKRELWNWLRGEVDIEFYEAEYARFGWGATEVHITRQSQGYL